MPGGVLRGFTQIARFGNDARFSEWSACGRINGRIHDDSPYGNLIKRFRSASLLKRKAHVIIVGHKGIIGEVATDISLVAKRPYSILML